MKISFFETHQFEKKTFQKSNENFGFEIDFLEMSLTAKTAEAARGSQVVCSFVNDKIDEECLRKLKSVGVGLVALRSAGFNHIDLAAADRHQMIVCRVPGYSPYAVAEFAVGLLLTLNRKIHRASVRVKELNFSLEGLVGFDIHGKTVGVIGGGRIGKIFAKIMISFGCRVLVHDPNEDKDLKNDSAVSYVSLDEIFKLSDIISLHVPLTKETHHLVNEKALSKMKKDVLIINTGRGGLIDAKSLIKALKSESIGGAALDVYEEEENIFFHDLSDHVLQDDILARLLTFPNIVLTSHQAFLTKEALKNIADTTLDSISEFSKTGDISSAKKVGSYKP